MQISVAGLSVDIEEGKHLLSTSSLPCHAKFLGASSLGGNSLFLNLRFAENPAPDPAKLSALRCRNEIWELWQDQEGNYYFTQPAQTPQRWVQINPDFTEGLIFGDFSSLAGQAFYPLEYLDIVLYSNWLAQRGDLILHASGIAWQNQAYVFLGNSGAGKSTLAADLAAATDAVILGEDQIILRQIEGRFFAFGTPWHEDPSRCDPRGVELSKIFFLDRAAEQTITPLGGFEASVRIMATAFVPYYFPARVQAILDKLAMMPAQTRAFVLSYQRGSDILKLITDA
ncbi:MAG TPA: hypothetical protein PKL82_03465 [Anaerolineaceae bacterium]|jgi:hypothetical protein|nr:hypothetical protein [Chloroflexota bacterium]HOA21529.1 hypothetical protein [Anaerolineaceae bacterium]